MAVVPPYGDSLSSHPDAVPLGQPADHVQAEPGGAGEVELRRVDDALVGGGEVLLAHAQAAVLDLDREPVGHQLCPRTSTVVCGGENEAAFSISSASRWMTSPTARPASDDRARAAAR